MHQTEKYPWYTQDYILRAYVETRSLRGIQTNGDVAMDMATVYLSGRSVDRIILIHR